MCYNNIHVCRYNDLKQVDIVISKNQVLQISYLKHCVYNLLKQDKLSYIRNLRMANRCPFTLVELAYTIKAKGCNFTMYTAFNLRIHYIALKGKSNGCYC